MEGLRTIVQMSKYREPTYTAESILSPGNIYLEGKTIRALETNPQC